MCINKAWGEGSSLPIDDTSLVAAEIFGPVIISNVDDPIAFYCHCICMWDRFVAGEDPGVYDNDVSPLGHIFSSYRKTSEVCEVNIHKLEIWVKLNWRSFGIILGVKTQIITLESHDDLISVRDRMSWAKTPRILLVWPKYENVTLRQVDLKVLQRHAISLGAQLGLVTRARRVREEAEAVRIPVFESAGQAQKIAWPAPRRKRLLRHTPRRDLRAKRDQVQVP